MNLFKKLSALPWFEIFILFAVLGVYGYAAFSDAYNLPNKWFTRDDAYYYFKIAQNISEGKGSTFDGINLTNGYHPLWTLVNIPIFSLARVDPILPLRILIIVLGGLRAFTSILLYRILKNTLSLPIALLAGFYWAFDLFIHKTAYQQGLETGLAAFCLVLFLYILQRYERNQSQSNFTRKEISILAIAGTLVVFSRLDLIFLVGIFGLWIIFRDKPIRYLLPIDILVFTISTVSAFIIRTGLPEYYQYSNMAIAMVAIGIATKVTLLYFLGLYEHPIELSLLKLIRQSAIAIASSTVGIMVIFLGLTKFGILQGSFPRTAPLIDGALSLALLLIVRFFIVLFSRKSNIKFDISKKPHIEKWRNYLFDSGLYYGILGASIGIYILWNQIVFGIGSPISGQVKRWWGSFADKVYGGSARSINSFFGLNPNGDLNAWHPITTIVGEWNKNVPWINSIQIKYDLRYTLLLAIFLLVIIFMLLINRKRAARLTYQLAIFPMLAGAGLQILQYNISGYAALKEWYWVSQMVLIVLVGSILLDTISLPLRRISAFTIILYFLVGYYGYVSLINFKQIIDNQMPHGARFTKAPYMEIVEFVETHTEPGSIIGMTGGGNVEYFIRERTIVNMDGLVNSYSYIQAHKSQAGSDFLYNMGLDYVFANPDILETQPYRGQYTNRLEIIDYYGGKAIMHFLPAAQ